MPDISPTAAVRSAACTVTVAAVCAYPSAAFFLEPDVPVSLRHDSNVPLPLRGLCNQFPLAFRVLIHATCPLPLRSLQHSQTQINNRECVRLSPYRNSPSHHHDSVNLGVLFKLPIFRTRGGITHGIRKYRASHVQHSFQW